MKHKVKRIGVFGGTFDPPHIGHMIIADVARQQLHLDKVLFVPAFLPPHKKQGVDASPPQRLAMLTMAIGGSPEFEIETLELKRKGTSYTVDTLRALKQKYGNGRLFLIVGGDNFRQFNSWKAAQEIRRMATIVVYERPDGALTKPTHTIRNVKVLKGGLLGISSTIIRKKVREGESIRFLVPRSVEQFIRRHKLYTA